MINDHVLDPYQPSVFVEILLRTAASPSGEGGDAASSYGAFLLHLTRLSAQLAEEFREQRFTIRVMNKTEVFPHTHFKVREIRRSDIVKVVRYVNAHHALNGVKAILLYCHFGFLTRLRPVRSMEEFFRLMVGR